jgi:integrase
MWRYTLEHLLAGTEEVPGFGEMYVDQIRPAHVHAWRVGISQLIAAGTYSPVTANGWLAILHVILKAAKRDFELSSDPTEGIPNFDTSEHPTYTEEEPNTLTADATAEFLTCMREECPQHYAMTYLGVATGLRPSSMRPLRRTGSTPDVLWDKAVILVRRSHTLGDEVMDTTKTKLRQRISVPEAVMEVAPLAHRHAARHAGAARLGAALSGRGWQPAHGAFRVHAVRPHPWPDRARHALHAARDEAHVQRPGAGGAGGVARHAQHLRAPDGPDARALFDGHACRAAREHRACASLGEARVRRI